MKFVQTFWSRPGNGSSLMDISAGWISPEYHWMSWALSCLQVRSFHENLELVTDERGKEILIDRLQLPYTSVCTSLESSLDNYPVELWSLAKILSCSLQEAPFLHLDGDVFIWKAFDQSFLRSGLLAQNVEMDIPYYRSLLVDINKLLPFVPGPFKFSNSDQPVYASNTGIFGGHRIAFIKEYCRRAFEFVDKNLHEIGRLPAGKRPLLNFIFEQYLLFCLAAEKGYEISYFIKEPVTDPAYRDYARLLDIPHVQLVHPVGDYKKRPFTCTQMARRLRKEYPEYYYRVLDECKKEIQLTNRFYHLFVEKPSEVFQQLSTLMPVSQEKATAGNFPLTWAAIEYMYNSKIINSIPARKEDAIYSFSQTISDAQSRLLFTEILGLELQKNKMAGILSIPNEIMALYVEDIRQYRLVADLFAGTPLDETKIYLNKNVMLVELSRKWEFSPADNLPDLIAEKWKQQPALEQVALWIEPELLEINEMYLSHLEMAIVDIAKSPVSIGHILQETRQYFDPEEIEKNAAKYKQVITNSLRHLLFSRVLSVE